MILALLLAAAAQLPNTVVIPACTEPSCVILSTTAPASFQFGVGASWCATAIVSPTLPLKVNYGPPNPILCASDPAQGVIKSLLAVQQSAPYTITYSVNGVTQTPFIVPAIVVVPPPPVIVSTRNCTGTLTTDSTGTEVLTLSCK